MKSPPSRRTKGRYVRLNVLPDQLWLKVRRGVTVWEALQNTDVDLEGDCGGLGRCGKCKIRVISAIKPASDGEKALLEDGELTTGVRLACRTRLATDLQVDVEESAYSVDYNQILKVGTRPTVQIDPIVEQRIVTSSLDVNDDEIAYLEKIKLMLGPQYADLEASAKCLRALPAKMERSDFEGVATVHRNRLLALQDWSQVGHRYGLVFDLGTTTLVGKLVGLIDGQEVAAVSCLNTQIKYGTDLIARLKFVKERPGGLQELQNMLSRDLNRIVAKLTQVGGLDRDDILIAVVAGNTTMQHLFLGVPPLSIAQAPFAPVFTDGVIVEAAHVGLRLHPEATLYVMPMKSGYVGGDLLGVILASGAADQEHDIVLGLDLGTNGEIFLGNRRRMLTCATAAGPAFEGARINNGSIARTGAIEGLRIQDEQLIHRVISNTKPRSLCGSGLVDLVAVLLHAGVTDHEGLIRAPHEHVPEFLASRIVNRGDVNAFLVVPGEDSYNGKPVVLTQKDVREVQLAKGAIAAGINVLLEEMGLEVGQIDRIFLAGALGNYVNVFSAMRLGLLPKVDPNMVTHLGNAATTGAEMVLLSKEYWNKARKLRSHLEHAELSTHPQFNDFFIRELDFPKENMW